MFSSGQLIFILFFIVLFISAIIYSYRKDSKLHKKEYKGSKWILIGFIAFVLLLFAIKSILK